MGCVLNLGCEEWCVPRYRDLGVTWLRVTVRARRRAMPQRPKAREASSWSSLLVPDGRRSWEGRWSWSLESESVMGVEAAAGSELVRAGEAAAGSETVGVGAAFPVLALPPGRLDPENHCLALASKNFKCSYSQTFPYVSSLTLCHYKYEYTYPC